MVSLSSNLFSYCCSSSSSIRSRRGQLLLYYYWLFLFVVVAALTTSTIILRRSTSFSTSTTSSSVVHCLHHNHCHHQQSTTRRDKKKYHHQAGGRSSSSQRQEILSTTTPMPTSVASSTGGLLQVRPIWPTSSEKRHADVVACAEIRSRMNEATISYPDRVGPEELERRWSTMPTLDRYMIVSGQSHGRLATSSAQSSKKKSPLSSSPLSNSCSPSHHLVSSRINNLVCPFFSTFIHSTNSKLTIVVDPSFSIPF